MKSAPAISIIDVMEDPKLLGEFFSPQKSWERWKVVLSAAFGLPPPKCNEIDPVEFYRAHTGRSEWPTKRCAEFWSIAGRRGGKSRVSALIAVFLACFKDYSAHLSPGEVGTVMVIAADRKQARTVFRYIRAMLMDNPLLRKLVESDTAESITLKNRICIEVHTANFRSTRGYTVLSAILDEIAFWDTDGANPDSEIINAIRGSFATIPEAMLLAISSPHARAGELWETYNTHFGDRGSPDVLVWQAASRDMNPSIPEAFIRRQYERDPAKAKAEYGGEFRTDVERFVPLEVVRACVADNVTHRPPLPDLSYQAFVDPSGGSGDPMVLAIGHRVQSGTIMHDASFVFQPPFKPAAAVAECAGHLRQYRISRVHGDRFGGEWPREEFRKHGIEYELHPRSKSELFVNLLPQLFSQAVDLLDDPKMVAELTSLERKASPSGREIVDHPKHGHDDRANAVAGMVGLLSEGGKVAAVW